MFEDEIREHFDEKISKLGIGVRKVETRIEKLKVDQSDLEVKLNDAVEGKRVAQELVSRYNELRAKYRETMDEEFLDESVEIEVRLKKALLGWRKF